MIKNVNIWFILIFILAISIIFQIGSHFEKNITITKKYTSVGGVRYIVPSYTIIDTENNIYHVSNVWWKADFNNAEDWNNIYVGKTYRVKGWGYRIPLFEMYPNIYEIIREL